MSQWPEANLDEVLLLNRSGCWGSDQPSETSACEAKVVRNSDITRAGLIRGHAVRYFSSREAERSALQLNDVALTTSGDVGKAWEVDCPGYFASNFVRILRPNPRLLAPGFLPLVLRSRPVRRALEASTAGTTIQNLQKSFYSAATFSLPPLPEQQRIVGILAEAFESIAVAKANTEKCIRIARATFDASLEAVFTECGDGWLNTTIGESIRFIDYRGRTPEKTNEGLRLITAKNVKMGYVQDTPSEFVAPSTYDGWMTRGIPRRGDVLFTTEAPLANVAQLDTDEKVVFAQRIIIMQPDRSKLDGTFLKYLLMSQSVQRRIHAYGTGATVKGIKASLLKAVGISFPSSVIEQQRLAAQFDALWDDTGSLASGLSRKLTTLDELQQSLLHRAFSGAL